MRGARDLLDKSDDLRDAILEAHAELEIRAALRDLQGEADRVHHVADGVGVD